MKDSPTARHWKRLEIEYPEVYAVLRPLYLEDVRNYNNTARGVKNPTSKRGPKVKTSKQGRS